MFCAALDVNEPVNMQLKEMVEKRVRVKVGGLSYLS